MISLKKLVFAAALLLSLVGGASTASADPGTPLAPATITVTSDSAGVTWDGAGVLLSAGVTWED
jgi:opacity protein-like surface antigen